MDSDKQEALEVLREAKWSYLDRISRERPYPAATSDYPGLNYEILEAAGIDVSGVDGEGVALMQKPEDSAKNDRYAVFGQNNLRHMKKNNIDTGQPIRRAPNP